MDYAKGVEEAEARAMRISGEHYELSLNTGRVSFIGLNPFGSSAFGTIAKGDSKDTIELTDFHKVIKPQKKTRHSTHVTTHYVTSSSKRDTI